MAIKNTIIIINNHQKTLKELCKIKKKKKKNTSYIGKFYSNPTPGLAVANFLFYYKYSSPKPQLAVAVLDVTPFCLRELIYFERE
jgi:hypothetical protein